MADISGFTQRKVERKMLLGLGYLLSRVEGQPGSPEKPLSDLGRVSYRAYWKHVILEFLQQNSNLKNISLHDIGEATGMMADDVIATLVSLDMITEIDSKCVIMLKRKLLDDHSSWCRTKQKSLMHVKPENLRWTPFVPSPHIQALKSPRTPQLTFPHAEKSVALMPGSSSEDVREPASASGRKRRKTESVKDKLPVRKSSKIVPRRVSKRKTMSSNKR